jgi:hypothetical protein
MQFYVAAFLISHLIILRGGRNPLSSLEFSIILTSDWKRDYVGRLACAAIVPGWLALQFHMRCFKAIFRGRPAVMGDEGLFSDPEIGQLTSIDGKTKVTFVEARFAVGACTKYGWQLTVLKMVVVHASETNERELRIMWDDQWKENNMSTCREGTGIAMFQAAIRSLIDLWED